MALLWAWNVCWECTWSARSLQGPPDWRSQDDHAPRCLASYLRKIRGRLTRHIVPTLLDANAPEMHVQGLCCVLSARGRTVDPALYSLAVDVTSASIKRITLRKITRVGLAAGTELASYAYTPVVDMSFYLRLKWDDNSTEGKTLPEGWVEVTKAKLARVIRYTDGSPLTSTVAEGGLARVDDCIDPNAPHGFLTTLLWHR